VNDDLIARLADIDTLRTGTPRQRAAWRALTSLGIMGILAPFDARLAGTIPIDVDIPGSDLDILCHARDLDALEAVLTTHFATLPRFRCTRKVRYGHPILLCEFSHHDFPIQVYGSPTPVTRQRAWVHLVAEAYLLAQADDSAKAQVRSLKRAGVKTEPAFAQVFGLVGDPYEALYELGAALLDASP
jgi:hypothetical protein